MAKLSDLSSGNLIRIAIGIFVFAFTIPVALTELFNVSTTNWGAATVALFGLIPLVIIAFFVTRFSPGKGS